MNESRMRGHGLGILERATGPEIGGNAGRAEHMAAEAPMPRKAKDGKVVYRYPVPRIADAAALQQRIATGRRHQMKNGNTSA